LISCPSVSYIPGNAGIQASRWLATFFAGESEIVKGTVKWFNERKGYGFLSADDGSGDTFVHFSAIEQDGFKTLKEGEKVEYEVVEAEKGKRATRVRRLME